MSSARVVPASVKFVVAFLLILPSTASSQNRSDIDSHSAAFATVEKGNLIRQLSVLPLSFEQNVGQANPGVRFLARGRGYSLLLAPTEAVVALATDLGRSNAATLRSERDGSSLAVIRLQFAGANESVAVQGMDRLPGESNYFIGNDPTKWRRGVPTFGKVKYSELCPGIDLVFYGNQNELESDFVIAPRADPSALRLHIQGAERLRINAAGDLVLEVANEEFLLKKPIAYQVVDSRRAILNTRYVLGENNEVKFDVSGYDETKVLVLDPVLSYSTYLGGTSGDLATAIAVDAAGNAYVTGYTTSIDFPTTPGSFESTFPAPSGIASFVTKISSDGKTLVYSTFLGGAGQFNNGNVASGTAIKVDHAGNAYVLGDTDESDFPIVNAFQTSCNQCNPGSASYDLFLSKLGPSGSALLYSTYFGGSQSDFSGNLAVDDGGAAFLTGSTRSADLPVTSGAFDRLCGTDGNCNFDGFGQPLSDAFVSKLDTKKVGLASLTYSTFLGGSSTEVGNDIAINSSGAAFVVGYTSSDDFPTSPGAFQRIKANSTSAAFVTKIKANGSGIAYSTYLAGSGTDIGLGIALDSLGDAHVTGWTVSTDFPVTPGAFDTSPPASYNAFVSKFNPNGTALLYSSYLGGSDFDEGDAIAVDSAGNAYVFGRTGSSDFPIANAVQAHYGGGDSDVFVSKLDQTGSELTFSTYLGGSDNDGSIVALSKVALGLAVTGTGDIYVAGGTFSANYPTTQGAFQTSLSGTLDGFVTKISGANEVASVSLTPPFLIFPSQPLNTTSDPMSVTVTNTGDADLHITGTPSIVGFNTADFAVAGGTTCINSASIAPGQSCVINVTFTPLTTSAESAQLLLSDNASDSPQAIPVAGGAEIAAVLPNPVPGLNSPQVITVLGGPFFTGATVEWQDLTNGGTGNVAPLTVAAKALTVSMNFTDATAMWQIQVVNPDGTRSNRYFFDVLGSDYPGYVNDYPFQNGPNVADPYLFFFRECTSYVAWRMNRDAGTLDPRSPSFSNLMAGGRWGNALQWAGNPNGNPPSNAEFLGFTVDSTPEVGAIAQWGKNECDVKCSKGHVAYVEAVNADGSVNVSEYNYSPDLVGGIDHQFGFRPNALNPKHVVPPRFIHIQRLAASPNTVLFGRVPVGASNSQSVTLTNPNAAIVITTIATAGDFAQTNTCSSGIPAGGSCQITISFAPSAPGPELDSLTIRWNKGTQAIPVAGTGLNGLTVSPKSVAFGSIAVGTTATKVVTLVNKTGADVALSSFEISGAPAFAKTATTCGPTLKRKAACTISVTFSPTAKGKVSGVVTITDDAINSPQTTNLNGTGT